MAKRKWPFRMGWVAPAGAGEKEKQVMFFNKEMFIEYVFTMEDGKVLEYRIKYNRSREPWLEEQDYPAWTKLGFQQCANCPLKKNQYSHCPAAIDAKEILCGFSEVLSWKEADVRVKTPEREYFKHCDAQTGLRSLIGFVMATSGCPILSPLRGMAHYHLPFTSLDEIVFRAASSYMLAQYFRHKDGAEPDLTLDGLKAQYKEIQTVNYDFLQRVQVASKADSSLDVISTLFAISALLSLDLDSHLDKLKPLFVDY